MPTSRVEPHAEGCPVNENGLLPGEEILPVQTTGDVVAALSLSDRELRMIAEAGRARALEHHTAEQRVLELESICGRALAGQFARSA